MPTIIDRYNETVVVYPFRPNNTKERAALRKPKRDFVMKNPRRNKIIKTAIRYLYESKQEKSVYFVTITTKQHETKFTDRQLYAKLHLWLKNRESEYICICERQLGKNGKTGTNDLHFHLVIRRKGNFDIKAEIERLSTLFNVRPHPALFDVKKLRGTNRIRYYLTKYVTKANKSSIFHCRTFSISKRFRLSINKFNQRNIIRPSDAFVMNNLSLFNKIKEFEYCTVYKFTLDLWRKACEFESLFKKSDFTPIKI